MEYQPDVEAMKKIAEKYEEKESLIIIGHGGSISTFYGIYNALKETVKKKVYFVQTIDPDKITEIKKNAHKHNSLVIAISKSGETVTQLEALMQFLDYDKVFITGAMGPLAEIAEKLQCTLIPHPPIGGRFSGLTEVALLPALMCGIDAHAIFIAGQEYLRQYQEENDAYRSADIMFQLEQAGIVDVFLQVYDAHWYPMTDLIVQLTHESFGKDGQGQTYFASESPESQHHSNQRFLGGRKNIAGWYIVTQQPHGDLITAVPDELKSVKVRDGMLGALDQLSLARSMRYEFEGTLQDARIHSIPVIEQEFTTRYPASVGRMIAFWQLFAVYSASLRGVNPFDQPQVENSKKISFDKRMITASML